LDILKLFLEAREDKNPVISIIDGDEGSVLLVAAAFGHLNIIVYYKDVLQFSNINPKNNIGKTPLSVASFEGHLHVAEYYIKNGYKASGKVSTLYIVQ
jgi:ankyrin repeat protein